MISPNFPTTYWRFPEALKKHGLKVLGGGATPYDELSPEQKYNLTELVEKKLSNVLTQGEIEKCLRTGNIPERLELQNIIAEILIQRVTLNEFIEQLKI
jgi:hypothetical protein